jgi:hypothetical protein
MMYNITIWFPNDVESCLWYTHLPPYWQFFIFAGFVAIIIFLYVVIKELIWPWRNRN